MKELTPISVFEQVQKLLNQSANMY
jgi:hypothetical protein